MQCNFCGQLTFLKHIKYSPTTIARIGIARKIPRMIVNPTAKVKVVSFWYQQQNSVGPQQEQHFKVRNLRSLTKQRFDASNTGCSESHSAFSNNF